MNKILNAILKDKQWMSKLLIGGLLMFIPVVNFFALGYLSRYAGNVLKTGRLTLPEWDEWGRLFMGGLIFFAILLVYGVLPLLIGWALSLALDGLTFGSLGCIPYIPLSIAAVIAPTLSLLGLFAIRSGSPLDQLFLKTWRYIKQACTLWKELLLANMTFVGICFVGAPLYGFALFAGFLLLIPYTIKVFVKSESE